MEIVKVIKKIESEFKDTRLAIDGADISNGVMVLLLSQLEAVVINLIEEIEGHVDEWI